MMTGVGMVLGTAAYMSPEQARGRAVDKRTDVWAFGCVLFEMLSGARAFDGEDVAETIGAVIHKEPAWAVLPATTPATVRTVLQRCLQKDPKQRIRDIGDVQLALGGAFESGAQFPVALPMVAAPPPKRSRVAVATAALMVTAGVATIVTLAVMRSAPTAKLQSVRFAIAPPAPQSVTAGFDAGLAISPDGSRVVYVSGSGPQRQLMVRAIDKLTAVPLRGTTGARFPFFSPDSRWVGFFTNLELRKAPLDGSSPVTLCRTAGPPSGASWGPDDTIVFSTGNIDGLLSVPATGGEPQVIAKPDLAKGETTYEARTVLPEGTVVFTILTAGNDKPRVVALNRKTGQRKTLVKGADRTFFYADTGQLLFGEGSDVRAVRFDLPSIEVVGEPVTVLEQVTTTRGRTHFGISRAGSLVYMTGGASSAGDDGSTQRSLVWVDRQGREQPLPAPRRPYAYPRLSPDGTRVAVDIRDQDRDIWIWDLARQSLRRLTFDPKEDLYPVWTPDGQRIVFSSTRAGAPNLFWQPADGTGSAERLTTGSNPQLAYAMSSLRDVLFREDKAGSGNDLHVLHLEGRRTESVVHLGFGENNADLSPDGRWLAYQSGESGQLEVYVRPFPRVDDGRWQISTGGGGKPVWTRNGRELCFLSNLLVACAAVQTTPTFSAGAPSTVLKARYWNFQAGRTFDVSADGQRFLMVKDESTDDPTASQGNLVVVLNWVEELKTRLPAR
jgi:serine/threonine-protein kinase